MNESVNIAIENLSLDEMGRYCFWRESGYLGLDGLGRKDTWDNMERKGNGLNLARGKGKIPISQKESWEEEAGLAPVFTCNLYCLLSAIFGGIWGAMEFDLWITYLNSAL